VSDERGDLTDTLIELFAAFDRKAFVSNALWIVLVQALIQRGTVLPHDLADPIAQVLDELPADGSAHAERALYTMILRDVMGCAAPQEKDPPPWFRGLIRGGSSSRDGPA